MKKIISFMVISAVVCTSMFSTVYADNGKKNNSNSNKSVTTKKDEKNRIKELKEQLRNERKDSVKRANLLKELAKEKKKSGDHSTYVVIDGTEVSVGSDPVLRDGKLLLPAKPILKVLGATMIWDQATNKITITKGDITIVITVGSKYATVNKKDIVLESKIEVKDGGVLLPMGLISKILKQTYDYDQDSGVVIIDEDRNPSLALNKPAAASSVAVSQGAVTFAASNAVDGREETRWASLTTTPQWISVDLGQQKYIGSIKLKWDTAFAKAYNIEVSNDFTAWTTVYATASGDGGTDEIRFAAGTAARFVRILCLEPATANGFSLREMEVFAGVQPAGTLTASAINITGAVNLTTEGVMDWANWGYLSPTAFNHKDTTPQSIGNYSVIGTASAIQVVGNPVMYTWSNGTPSAIVTNSVYASYIAGVGNGFQFTVPADTNARTLQIYVGAWAAKGKLEVSLSDGVTKSFTGFVESNDSISCKLFTINYKALTAGQVLTVKYTVDKQFSSVMGGVSLQAAAIK